MLAVALGTIACSSDHMGTGPVASRLAFTVQPSAATAGVVITPAIQVTAYDDAGAIVTSFTGTITIGLTANPNGATLSGTLTRGAVGGVATFSDLRLNRTGTGYAFLASSGALTAAASGGFAIAPAPPAQFVFAVQPSDVTAGAGVNPAVQVQARDSVGNLTPSFTGNVMLTLSPNGPGAILAGTTTVAAVAGVAVFPGLHVDKSGSGYTIQAAGTLAGATSASFNVSAAAASQLRFTVQPSQQSPPVAGQPISLQVTARDPFGNTATAFSGTVSIALGANPPGGALSGTTSISAVSGVATFSSLTLSKSGSGYTFVATSAGLGADTTAPFTVNPGNPSAISTVIAVPTTIAASSGSSAATITVTAKDVLGNPVPGVAVTLAATGNGNTVTQPAVPTDAFGVTTGSLSATLTGAKVVSATVGGVLATQTDTVTVTAASATSLSFSVQPSSTSTTSPITPAVQVTAHDAFGNRATGFAGAVTLAIGTNPGSGTLTGTLTAAADSGVAIFSNLRIDKAGSGYTLVASSSTLTQGTSAGFAITVGLASKLAFSVQPSNAAAGAAITPTVQVAVQDAGGNLVTAPAVAVAVAIGTNPSGGVLSGTASVLSASGIAQFSNLSIDKSGTGYTLQATATGLTTAVSTSFTIASGTADHLAYVVEPANTVAGVAIAPAVKVQVLDVIGNVVTTSTANITVAILDNPNNGVLSGTATVAAVAGVATFSNLSINKSGTGYSLAASASGVTGDVSADFDITAASAARVNFFVDPTSTTAGTTISPSVDVEVVDAFGNRVPTATNAVTLSFGANPGAGTLSGTLTQSAVGGLASFDDLSINKVGNSYKLRATSSGLNPPDTSGAFNISPGPASTLVFTQQPTPTAATAAIAPAVKVTARDALGNTATSFTGSIAMAIVTNAGGGTLSGTLSVAAVAGVATFSDLHIDKIGTGYTLGATAIGLTGATSSGFNIVVGSATQLAFFAQPVGTTGGATLAAVQVEVRDAGGNRVTTAGNSISLAFGSNANSGTLSGTTTQAAVSGVATFNTLKVDSAGTGYTLAASATGLTGATSTPFNITVGPAAVVGFLVPPSNTVPGQSISPDVQVEVRDLGGNRVTSSGATIALAIGSNPGSGTLSGTTSHVAVSGLATFPGLSINNAGSGYTLVASSSGLTPATSPGFDIFIGSATKLGFFVQPTSTTGGAAISPAVQVEIQDVGGNRVTSATNSVTLAIGTNAHFGSLYGTKTVAAVAGVATFTGISLDSAGTGYTLDASASGLTGTTSSAFNINVGLAAKLGFHVAPSNASGGAAITPAVEVEVQDAGGNRVTSAGNTVTISLAANPKSGTLSGTAVVGAASGIATFANLSIDSAASGYRLGAAASGLTGSTSATFTISVGAAAKLGFLVQPNDVTAGVSIAPAVKVEVRDAGGNRVTTAGNTVGIAIGTNPGGGTLSGTSSQAAVSGVATFSNLSINKSGAGYALAATTTGLTGATSAGFTVSADGVAVGQSTLTSSADTVGQCNVSCSPTFQSSSVTVTVKDQFGNPISGSPVVVSANGTGNVFAPSGSGTTDVNGVFTTTYNAAVAEGKTLSATAGGLALSQTPAVAVMPALVGAGDIADCNSIRDDATANQLDSIPGTVFADGDNAYPNGTATNFTNCYDPTWGRHKARTRPVVGNHEYDSSGTAAAYFSYFGAATADPQGNGYGYYSYDIGAWHIVVLNSDSGVTSPSSNQLTWLQADVAGRTNQCLLALWHRPLFTSGSSGGASFRVRRLWQALENAGAEIVVNGHDHIYERFAPQDSLGNATSAGIREFIVGTGGGETHGNFPNSPANVEATDAANFSRGVLRLTLYPNSYRWEFLAANGFGTFADSGSGTCH